MICGVRTKKMIVLVWIPFLFLSGLPKIAIKLFANGLLRVSLVGAGKGGGVCKVCLNENEKDTDSF